MTPPSELERLRGEVEQLNFSLLELLSRRAGLVTEIQQLKTRDGIPTYLPERERQMLSTLVRRNRGPFDDETVCRLFKEIFRASVELMESTRERSRRLTRARGDADAVVAVRDAAIGAEPVLIAGPCAVESAEQMEEVAERLAALGVRFLRGGAFKPRTSPYSFQGLGAEGLVILHEVARRHGLVTVSEVTDPRQVELAAEHIDLLQVGSRNMYNYDLLREVGLAGKPVLLKRGLSATIDELLWSAEHIAAAGNEQIVLCERGIRTYETETRNTLDLSAVALLRQRTFLPVLVDVSHAAGRRDILTPLAKAALAVGASGVMVEVHPCPAVARSDNQQQLDLRAFERFARALGFVPARRHAATA